MKKFLKNSLIALVGVTVLLAFSSFVSSFSDSAVRIDSVDGAPNESPEMVRKAVKDVEKDGFSVVAISINPHYDPSTMYSNNVTFTNLDRLAVELGKQVGNAILGSMAKNATCTC